MRDNHKKAMEIGFLPNNIYKNFKYKDGSILKLMAVRFGAGGEVFIKFEVADKKIAKDITYELDDYKLIPHSGPIKEVKLEHMDKLELVTLVNKLESENEELQKSNEWLRSECTKLGKSNCENIEENAMLKEENAYIFKENNDRKGRVKKHIDTKLALGFKVQDLNKVLEEERKLHKKTEEELIGTIKNLKIDMHNATAGYIKQRDQANEKIENFNKKIGEQESAHVANIADWKNAHANIAKEKDELESVSLRQHEELIHIGEERIRLKGELNKQKARHRTAISDCHVSNAMLVDENNKLRNRVSALEHHISRHRSSEPLKDQWPYSVGIKLEVDKQPLGVMSLSTNNVAELKEQCVGCDRIYTLKFNLKNANARIKELVLEKEIAATYSNDYIKEEYDNFGQYILNLKKEIKKLKEEKACSKQNFTVMDGVLTLKNSEVATLQNTIVILEKEKKQLKIELDEQLKHNHCLYCANRHMLDQNNERWLSEDVIQVVRYGNVYDNGHNHNVYCSKEQLVKWVSPNAIAKGVKFIGYYKKSEELGD